MSLRSVAKPLIGIIAIQLCGLSACSDPPVEEAKRVRISSLKEQAGSSQKTEGQGSGVVEIGNEQGSESTILTEKRCLRTQRFRVCLNSLTRFRHPPFPHSIRRNCLLPWPYIVDAAMIGFSEKMMSSAI